MKGASLIRCLSPNFLLAILVTLLLGIFQAPGNRYDFCTYYTAGALLLDGQPAEAFGSSGINRKHRELHDEPGRKGAFLYSPLYLLPAAALSRLPFGGAQLANHLLTLGCLGLLLFLLLREARTVGLKILLCLVFLLAHPVTIQFRYQNWSFLLVTLAALAWIGTRRGWRAAPLFWALALHLKVVAGALLLPLLLAGRRRLVVSALVTAILLGALALPAVGLDSYLAWGERLAAISEAGVTPFFNKLSLQATVARFLQGDPREWLAPRGPVTHPAVRWLFWISLPLFLLLLWRLRGQESRAFGLAIPYLLLFTQQVWDHGEILLLLLFAVPAFPASGRWMLGILLCVSWSYEPAIQHLLLQVLNGQQPASLLRLALLFYPALNLLAAAALLARPDPEEPGGVEPAPM